MKIKDLRSRKGNWSTMRKQITKWMSASRDLTSHKITSPRLSSESWQHVSIPVASRGTPRGKSRHHRSRSGMATKSKASPSKMSTTEAANYKACKSLRESQSFRLFGSASMHEFTQWYGSADNNMKPATYSDLSLLSETPGAPESARVGSDIASLDHRNLELEVGLDGISELLEEEDISLGSLDELVDLEDSGDGQELRDGAAVTETVELAGGEMDVPSIDVSLGHTADKTPSSLLLEEN